MQIRKSTARVTHAFGVVLLLSSLMSLGSIRAQAEEAVDYDADDDGLIEVFNLEHLDAIRYDLDGDGEADDPSDADAYAEAFPNALPGGACPNSGCAGYELMGNLDFNDPNSYASGSVDKGWSIGEGNEGWRPIGPSIDERFNSTFDGNGHTIANLFIARDDDVGLFGSVGSAGAIRRVGLVEARVSGWERVGALAGANYGAISGSYATGSVRGNLWVGGLVGSNKEGSTINDSYATGSVQGDVSIGGLAGSNGGAIIGSHATGNVTGDNFAAGGLVGFNSGPISASYATGNVSGTIGVGGLVADNNRRGKVISSYAAGNVSGDSRVGGLVGESYATVAASYATGGVSGIGTVGGLVGGNFIRGTIISSYATGNVSGKAETGGLAGYNAHGSTIRASYATGRVSEASGGLVGVNNDPNGIAASYWDIGTSGQSYGVGFGFNSGAKGKTTVELQAPTTYTDIYSAWDMDIDNADGDGDETTGADDPWSFGSADQYPALQVDFDGDGIASWDEFGDQPRGEAGGGDGEPAPATPTPTPSVSRDYDADDDGLIEVSSLEHLDAIRYDLDGDGEADDPSDADAYAESFPNALPGGACPNSGCAGYELMGNLDFNDPNSYASGSVDKGWSIGEGNEGWRPIGPSIDEMFNSTFDGNGHTIANLFIARDDDVGLFGRVGSAGAIRRVGLVEARVSGWGVVGALAGANDGAISGSYATGSVRGNWWVGGLVGSNEGSGGTGGTISDSYATGSVQGDVGVGGLAGDNGGAIIGSHATGNVSGDDLAGGLVGSNSGPISASYATGNVSGNIGSGVGGLVGNNKTQGNISASYATGNVSGSSRVGGLVGENYDMIAASYATGGVSGIGKVGGLTGANFIGGTIISSYATGNVSGDPQAGGLETGGLAGYNAHGSTIRASYATGRVSEASGGLVGVNDDPNGIAASYWDIGTSGQSYGVAFGFNSGAKGKTTVELQAPTTYTDIYSAWNMDIDNADGDDDETTGADDPWSFGSADQYPALQVDFDGDGIASWEEFGDQPRGEAGGGDGEPAPATPTPTPSVSRDYDADDDGLIEVSSLEHLDAIRYDLDGDGEADHPRHAADYAKAFSEAVGTGCPGEGCVGYELARDLDFDDPGSYASGSVDRGWSRGEGGEGWLSIGWYARSSPGTFQGTFEGNGHTIAGLFVRHSSFHVGLFSLVGFSGVIRRVGLARANVSGGLEVGALVGRNGGTIIGSYATGNVSGGDKVGGLVGLNAGAGVVVTSYAAASVSQGRIAGGLVGENNGAIRASYATGSVSGEEGVGGLVGNNHDFGTIRASYATGSVKGDECAGGLVGSRIGAAVYAGGTLLTPGTLVTPTGTCFQLGKLTTDDGRVIARIGASYWDVEASGHAASTEGEGIPGVEGKTTAELQSPAGYTGIYFAWNIDIDNADGDHDEMTGPDDPWDFGTAHEYPALKVDFKGDGRASWQEFGDQRRQRPSAALPAVGGPSVPGGLLLALSLAGGLLILAGLVALRARRPAAAP